MLARRLLDDFQGQGVPGVLISLDNWLLGVDQRTGAETVRERFRYSAIAEAVALLREGIEVFPPVYDPQTRRVVSQRGDHSLVIPEHGMGIVDGVVALDIAPVRMLSDVCVFIDVADAVRRSRLIDFYTRFKDCSLQEATRIIEEREAEEIPIIKASKKYADVIYHPSEE